MWPLTASDGGIKTAASGARIVNGTIKTTAKNVHKTIINEKRSAIRARREERRDANTFQAEMQAENPGIDAEKIRAQIKQITTGTALQHQPQKKKKKNQSPVDLVRRAFRTLRAVMAAISMLAFYFWFFLIQFSFGIIFIVANYLESTWVGWFIPGWTISLLGWAVCSTISLVFMFIAITSLVVARAKVGKQLTMLMFLIGITGSIVPYFNLIPWPALFMAVAVANQK